MLKIISHFICLDASCSGNTYPFCYMRQTHSILPQRLNMTILHFVTFTHIIELNKKVSWDI
jgi:hypothetical protein